MSHCNIHCDEHHSVTDNIIFCANAKCRKYCCLKCFVDNKKHSHLPHWRSLDDLTLEITAELHRINASLSDKLAILKENQENMNELFAKCDTLAMKNIRKVKSFFVAFR